MDKVLPWIKANVAIVVLAIVIVVAPALAFYMRGKWNKDIHDEAASRAAKLPQVEGLTKTNVSLTIPGSEPISLSTAVNQRLLDEYKRVTEELKGDSTRVRELALTHNRKGRAPLIPRLFPEMPAVERDTLPPEMFEAVNAAYVRLLQEVRAGSPPKPDLVAQQLQSREEQYISTTLRKRTRADLEPTELKDLTTELSQARLAKYGESAQGFGMYAGLEAFILPPAALKASATEGEMFVWQWNLWVVEDVMRALAAINGPQGSVVANPVKRVLSVRPLDGMGFGGNAPGAGAGAPTGGRQRPSFGGMGVGESAPPPADASMAGTDPGAGGGVEGGAAVGAGEAARDFKLSITGRTSNPLYDVRPVELRMIASMERLPAIIDALAKRNFITVLDLQLRPADPFAAATQGFIYGSEPVVEVTLLLETVWLREWTTPFMPRQVKESLKIPVASPAGAAAPADGATPPTGG